MGTRVDINDELAEQLRSLAKARGVSLRAFVEEALQGTANSANVLAGLKDPFAQRTFDLGGHLENPWMLLSDMEIEGFEKVLQRK